MFTERLHESNQTSENLPSCRRKLHVEDLCVFLLDRLTINLVTLRLQPATGALLVSVCENELNLPRLQKKKEKRKVEVKCSLTRSGVAPHLCSASRPGKLRSGPASLEPTQRRRSASPCLIYWGHPAAKHKDGLKTDIFSLSAVELHCSPDTIKTHQWTTLFPLMIIFIIN